jgi:hypothetical protein
MTDTLPPLPLSDEQIIAVRKQQSGRYGSGGLEPYADSIAFARAILRAALPAAQPVAWLCCGSLFHAYDAIPANMLPPMGSPVPLYAVPVAAQPTSGVRGPECALVCQEHKAGREACKLGACVRTAGVQEGGE